MRLHPSFPGIHAGCFAGRGNGCAQYAPVGSEIVNGAYFMNTWKRIFGLSFGLLCFATCINSGYCAGPELRIDPHSLTFSSLFPGQGDTLSVTAFDSLFQSKDDGAGDVIPADPSILPPGFYIGTVRIDSAVLSDPEDFTVISGPMPGDTITLGDSSHFLLHYTPSAFNIDSTRNGTLLVYWSVITPPISNEDPPDIPQTPIAITLTGRPGAELTLAPMSLNFDSLTLGKADTLCTVTATNSRGLIPLKILNVGVFGDTNFSLISGPGIGDSIPPGESRQYCIQFNPTSPGGHGASFSLFTDGVHGTGAQSVALRGQGVAPVIQYGVQNLFHRIFTKLVIVQRSISPSLLQVWAR